MDGILTSVGTLTGDISANGTLSGEIAMGDSLNGELTRAAQTLTPAYTGDYSFTPSESAQTVEIDGKRATDDITIGAIPSQYIVPSGSITIVSDDTYDVTEYASAVVNVGSPPLQTVSKSYTPSESAQSEEVAASSGYYGLEKVSISVGAIDSDYVGSAIDRRDGDDLTASGATVSVPAGYYENAASKAVASGAVVPASAITATGATLSTDTGTLIMSQNCTNAPHVSTAGYISEGTSGSTAVTLKASATIDPTPTASGDTVTIPSGYYTASTTKSVASGTEGTPTATKGTVSSHSISVTPSVTNTTGYITGSTKTGTAVTVSASELVSGTYTVDSSGTKDVTNYASASVPAGTAGTPSASKGTVSNHSISVTPSVTNTTGFITGSTKTGTAVTVSASELVSGSQTVTSNDTYDVTNLAELIVNVAGGGGGLTYETGTYTLTSNSYRPSVEFANTHSEAPVFVLFSDMTGTAHSTTNTNYNFMYCDFYKLWGYGIPYSSSGFRYAIAYSSYRTSSTTSLSSTAVICSQNSDSTGTYDTSNPRYWADSSGFYPYSNSTSRLWRSGRTYKWIAIWA